VSLDNYTITHKSKQEHALHEITVEKAETKSNFVRK